MYSLLLLVFTVVIGILARRFFSPSPSLLLAEETAAFGFLLLASFFAGRLLRKTPVPQLTGYLVLGLIVGPFVLGVVPERTVENLNFLNDLALALIAFAAGSKVKLRVIKENASLYFWVTLIQSLIVLAGVALPFAVILYFYSGGKWGVSLIGVGAVILAVAAVAKSPSTTIAVILETGAKGPVTDAVIGITIIKDVVIVFLFTFALSLAEMVAKGGGFRLSEFFLLSKEIVYSILAGIVFGIIFSLYFRGEAAEKLVFVLGAAFFITLVSQLLHLHFLLSCMVAGFVVENFSKAGEEFHRALEESYLPIIIVFFSISGASLDLSLAGKLILPALAFVILRLIFIYIGTKLGMAAAGEQDENVKRWAWLGFIGQAGLTLGFAAVLERDIPQLGSFLKNLLIAAVIINQIIGPVLFRIGLEKSNEIFKR